MTLTKHWPLDKLQDNGFALLKSVVATQDIVSLIDSIERLREESSRPGMRFFPDLSYDDVWKLLVDTIHRQLNVSRDQITPEASFVRDLGMC